jgi:hypothetical protein
MRRQRQRRPARPVQRRRERDAAVGRVELKKGERNPRNEGVEEGMLIL